MPSRTITAGHGNRLATSAHRHSGGTWIARRLRRRCRPAELVAIGRFLLCGRRTGGCIGGLCAVPAARKNCVSPFDARATHKAQNMAQNATAQSPRFRGVPAAKCCSRRGGQGGSGAFLRRSVGSREKGRNARRCSCFAVPTKISCLPGQFPNAGVRRLGPQPPQASRNAWKV